jgi:IS30 family transposase
MNYELKFHRYVNVNWFGLKKNLKKIRSNDKLERYIRKKMKDDWSPELVS